MTAILGISAFYHDSAVALVIDGRLVFAAQEERYSRLKYDSSFPALALADCLRTAGLHPADLDYVGFYEKPLRKFDRLLQTWLATAPGSWSSFRQALPRWLSERLFVRRELHRRLPGLKRRLIFADHHGSHAASAFYPSPFEQAAILTVDGVGEWTTLRLSRGQGNRIEGLFEQRFPHSLGLLYSSCASYCGFRVDSGESKLMGLAPYGTPRFVDRLRQEVIDLKADGSFCLNLKYFEFHRGLRMTNRRFAELWGAPPRVPETELAPVYCDLAASIQQLTEEILIRLARTARERTGMKRLCMAGGVALNCAANGRLAAERVFDEIWVQPAAGDAGGALGTAFWIWRRLLAHGRPVPHVAAEPGDLMSGARLGSQPDSDGLAPTLQQAGLTFERMGDLGRLCERTAEAIAQGRIVGWVHGRMEFGPRALGGRSILADPRRPEIRERLNQLVKRRETFRPFAPVVLQSHAADYFDVPPDFHSPYMLFTARVRGDQLPAVTHVDGSARVQTVSAADAPELDALLRAFERKTGCAVLVNTSLNVRGEPLVRTGVDALHCFLGTELDVLVVEDVWIEKSPGVVPGDSRISSGARLFPLD